MDEKLRKIGIDEWCFSNHLMKKKLDHLKIVEIARNQSVSAVGLDYFLFPKVVKNNPNILKDKLDEGGIELVLGYGIPFALPEVLIKSFRSEEKSFLKIAEQCQVKTVRVVGGVVAPIKGFKPLHLSLNKTYEIKLVAKNLKEFSKRLGKNGLRVALEYHMDYRGHEMMEILERVNEPNFGFTLDTGNAFHIDENPLEVAKKLAPHTIFTHIKDMKRVGNHAECVCLGDGAIPLKAIIQVLDANQYTGIYCLENALKPGEIHLEGEYVEKGISWLRSNLYS